MASKPPTPTQQSSQDIRRVEQRVEQQVIYQGPIPPPAIVEQLDHILPGAANRIFVMAEKEQDRNIRGQNEANARLAKAQNDEHCENMCALWMAFILCLVFCGCGVLLMLKGYEKWGGTLLGITTISVVASFLKGHFKKK